MKHIAIISGKGGTGKTIIAASFAALGRNVCLVDCDVDAADLHLLLKPEVQESHEFRSGHTAVIDKNLCTQCGECTAVCRFNAISEVFTVDPISCEGCGVCSHVCPAEAIAMRENVSGEWFVSQTKYGPFVHARLGIAEENSGKLVTKIKQVAAERAERHRCTCVIVDGPPGIGCPVIASLTGVDVAVIVTEPTLSGIHDMERVAGVARHFSIPTKVVINKCDINQENSNAIATLCEKENIEVVARIPFSKKVVESMVNGVPVVEFCHDDVTQELIALWKKLNP